MVFWDKIATPNNLPPSICTSCKRSYLLSHVDKVFLTAANYRANEKKNFFTRKTCVKNVFVCAKEIFHVVFNKYIHILFVLIKIPHAMKAMHKYL